MTTLLRFDGVTLRRGGRLLVERFDLAIAGGEGVQLRGPNGVGKSSLIRLAAGLLRANEGRVARPEAVALADDNLALDREKTLGEALAFWGGDWRGGLERAGIGGLSDVPVRLLSSGQRKRATLARVFGSGAPLWLLDEPLNALDGDGTQRLADAIAEHRHRGGGVLAASHAAIEGDWAIRTLAT